MFFKQHQCLSCKRLVRFSKLGFCKLCASKYPDKPEMAMKKHMEIKKMKPDFLYAIDALENLKKDYFICIQNCHDNKKWCFLITKHKAKKAPLYERRCKTLAAGFVAIVKTVSSGW